MSSRTRVSLVVAACLLLPIAALAQQGGGNVPAPKRIVVTALPDIKNWSMVASSEDPLPRLDFTVDLDMLAPLGMRPENAATYFAHFAKASGDRAAEIEKAPTTMVEGYAKSYAPDQKPPLEAPPKSYAPDEKLLFEAQPWVDVATMKFYPDIYKLTGPATEIPNLLHFMTLGRSWSARASTTPDREAAKEDCRRVIRLGRLARQESVTVIQDLVGLALIKMGASGLYQIARTEGDSPTMTVAALASAEASMFREAMRLTIEQLSVDSGEKITDKKLERNVRTARESEFRPMRIEALMNLYWIANTAPKEMRAKATAVTAELAKDKDPLVAAAAQFNQKLKWSPALAAMLPKE